MRALDLFCGAGGAGAGLALAGFDVTGIDREPQPHYPFRFILGDALLFEALRDFDFIWASPPCQGFTAYRRRPDHVRPRDNLIPETRSRLRVAGVPYVIENVVWAPLERPVRLCGSMFGLDVQRHRHFEASFWIDQPMCDHAVWSPRYPPATNRANLRKTVEIGVWRIPLDVQRRAMGISWMDLHELTEAIPPAYAYFIANQWKRGKRWPI